MTTSSDSTRGPSAPNQRRTMTTLGIAAVTWLLCASMVLVSAQTQPSPKPFTKDDVVELLTGNVPAKRVETLARERGIDFQITPETESELRQAGATDPLLAALRDLAPKPPTLVVTTTSGGAQVFVDDELIARTSAEGRLKISTLTAGRHKLRVSLDGYRDYEKNVDLAAGKTVETSAVLEPNTQRPSRSTPSGELAATGGDASRASPPGNTLTFVGSLRGHSLYTGPTLPGTMTVGSGKLQFSCKDNKHSFAADLKDVVVLSHYKSSVEFEVRMSNKKVHHTFWIQMGDQDSNERTAKELYDALRAGAK